LETASTVVQLMRQIECKPAGSDVVESSGEKTTIGELWEPSNRLANAFIRLGLRRGDRVVYEARNHARAVELARRLSRGLAESFARLKQITRRAVTDELGRALRDSYQAERRERRTPPRHRGDGAVRQRRRHSGITACTTTTLDTPEENL
jgi:hypothetical protein